jgi:hypothetical protein
MIDHGSILPDRRGLIAALLDHLAFRWQHLKARIVILSNNLNPVQDRKPTRAFLRLTLVVTAAALSMTKASAQDGFAYLAESVCADASGHLVPELFNRDCNNPRFRGKTDAISYQRHDWPARLDALTHPRGYQRSVSYLAHGRSGVGIAVQSFDFGGGDRGFGRFDTGKGDGGQTVEIRGGTALITMTEDGSGGVQWFTGEACRGQKDLTRSGWVLFGPHVTSQWTTTVTNLRTTKAEADCPAQFDPSYTRWRRLAIDWPILIDGRSDPQRSRFAEADTIVSEHFGGGDPRMADHLERFFLVRGLGLARWERWEQPHLSKHDNLQQRAENLANSGRCPEINGSQAPDTGWIRIDCRIWTNFVQSTEDAASFGWGHQK